MIIKIKYDLEKLKNSTDNDLIDLIYDKASELADGTFGEKLSDANPAMQELLATCLLESEVYNGGFDQFFLNNGLEWGEYAIQGLKRISAFNYVKVLEKAIEIYKNQGEEFENVRNPNFNTLDDSFYGLEGLDELQVKYIRNNYELFLVK